MTCHLSSNQCPECGADIEKLGAWPEGKPVRRHLVNRLAVWLAIVMMAAAPLTLVFYRHTSLVRTDTTFPSFPYSTTWGGVSSGHDYEILIGLGVDEIDWPWFNARKAVSRQSSSRTIILTVLRTSYLTRTR